MQLSLFDINQTGIICDHCNKDPGRGKNFHVWNGFKDLDTKQRVCWNCKDEHYRKKSKTEFHDYYSEIPIVVNI